MKNLKSSLTFIFSLLTFTIAAQNSTWEGKVSGIPINLKIKIDSLTKKQNAEFDSPTQGAFGLKVSDLQIKGDSLTAISAVIGGGFKGKFNATKTEIVGKWMQRGQELPMTLIKIANNEPLKRPQTPKAPFPYTSEDLIYYNSDKSIKYGATLTLPKSEKPAPAVILITGSGQEDRNETIFGHQPFWVIADYLSRNGIAVLRVDDRGVGQSTGDVMNATSLDFANDVLVGIDYLKTKTQVDKRKIGLIGHSEGGMIAPLVAIKSEDVAFIVSMAGVGVKGSDILIRQQSDALKKSGASADDQKRLLALSVMMIKLSDKYPVKEDLKVQFNISFKRWLTQQPQDFLKRNGFEGIDNQKLVNNLAASFYLPWMRYFMTYDPSLTLPKLTIPILAINGEKDIQVNAETNLNGFKKYLLQAGNKNSKTILFPNLNHMFQNAKTGDVSEYLSIEETISPEVLNVIAEWIKVQAVN